MTFERKEIGLGSGPTTYFVGGSGEPLLYLHPASGVAISKPLEALAQTRTVYMPVTPGFDGTAPHEALQSMEALASFASAFIDAAIGKRCDVIGASFGGWQALWLAVKHAATIDHLVLEAPAGVPAGGKGGLPADPAALRAKLFAYPERAPPMTKPLEQIQGNRRMLDRYRALSLADAALPTRVAEIKAPTLILMGTKDEIIPRETGQFLKGAIAGSHLAYIYDAAHVIESDQPERLLRIVASFLERGEAYIVNWGASSASAVPGGVVHAAR
ncbi:MAG TPA: alpha/beta hydrolase [Stellaceae bacterium]|nr:alpha/beta hydrolase [Stellaceae bacterium]